MMTLNRSQQTLLALWIVATIVGWVVGFYACEVIKHFISTVFTDGLVIGTAIGLAQWVVLRRRIAPIGWWVAASIVGFGAAKAVAQLVLSGAPGVPPLASSAITGVLIGLAVGILQGLLLRRHGSGGLRWIVANVLGWGLGWIAIGSVGESSDGWAYIVGAAGAAIAAVITGYVLVTDFGPRAA